MKTRQLLSLSVLTFSFILLACQKNENGNSNLKIRMTDAPAALEEVNIDLEQVNIKFEKDSGSWTSMQTNAGIYNLLDFQNGVDTLIAQGNYPQESVKEIRLVLGPNNTVKEGGTIYPLRIPSGSESGLKIKINRRLRTGLDSLLIDFDAHLSIRKEGDHYKLRPVIRLK